MFPAVLYSYKTRSLDVRQKYKFIILETKFWELREVEFVQNKENYKR
jgi:hypothetical protein